MAVALSGLDIVWNSGVILAYVMKPTPMTQISLLHHAMERITA
jgi:hypothetical protein